MADKEVKNPFEISTSSKIFCLNINCVNNVQGQDTCNLKGVLVDEKGVCSGKVKIDTKKKKGKSKKSSKK